MANILEVKNLKISFRTTNGTLKAVRDISFNLEKGRTLAIVGESGSGKSVTSKAVLGILAGNSIVEGGEIIYDGKDLLRISEEEMCEIRGDEISMIFQDPLSSLNPIVKIGKQITEAMLLKNKTSRKDARNQFNTLLGRLQENMIAASPEQAEQIKQDVATFDKFCIHANKLENSYNTSASQAEALVSRMEDFLFRMSKKQKLDVKATLKEMSAQLAQLKDPFFTAGHGEQLQRLTQKLKEVSADYVKGMEQLPESVSGTLEELKNLLKTMGEQPRPDFFRIGLYALRNPEEQLAGTDVEELNQRTLEYLDANFMNDFLPCMAKGLENSWLTSRQNKQAVLPALAEAKAFFAGEFTQKDAMKYTDTLCKQVEASIDRVELVKDNAAYTLRSGLNSTIRQYFAACKNNPKEEARFARQTARRESLIARGKHVDWKVVPKTVYDLDELKERLVVLVTRLEAHYAEELQKAQPDFHQKAVAVIDFLKEKASKVVYKVTPSMAKERAIKLMEEVGIAEPRMRFYQYPFEFSGGMRQRIVIAIALAADPEILICDEPTTALDVTIQAQILELINNLKRERNLSVIFITHDLGVVANMADDIAVMYAGKIVEFGTAEDIFYDPRHPYTWALLSSMPDLDTKEKLDAIPGTPPNMIYPPVGDAFADRNKYAMQIDFEMQPPMFSVSDTHKAATWLLHPDAPAVEMPKIITERIARMKKKNGGESVE